MSIGKTLGRVGILLAVTATVAIGQTNQVASVKIGTLNWTKQNINIETSGSWCYDNKPANCAKYGRLYTWIAAYLACQDMGGTWRLPNNDDWDNLIKAVGGGEREYLIEHDGEGDGWFGYINAGKKLKSKSGWDGNGKGTDDYGFSALPGGSRYDGSFYGIGISGSWWSATEIGHGKAYSRDMLGFSGSVQEGGGDGRSGFSARCVAQD